MNTSVITLRRQFVQFYGSPKILATESAALQELLLLTRLIEKFNILDPYVLEFCVVRVRLIRELFPSLRNNSCDLLKVLANRNPSGLPYSRPIVGNRFTSDWWERESKNQFNILKPTLIKKEQPKKKIVKNKIKKTERPKLRDDIPVFLISGTDFNKKALEDACGYKIGWHVIVERNSQSVRKIQALWDTTHMQPYGLVVCLCKHISHTVTQLVAKDVNGSSDWEMVNCFNDNVKIVAKQITEAIAKHAKGK